MKLTTTLVAGLMLLSSCGGSEDPADGQAAPATTQVTTTTILAPSGGDDLDFGPFVGSDPEGLILDIEWLDPTDPLFEAPMPLDNSGVALLEGSEPQLLIIGVNGGGCTPGVTISAGSDGGNPQFLVEIGAPIVREGLECIDLLKTYVLQVSLSEPVDIENVFVGRPSEVEAANDSGLAVIVAARADGSIPEDVVVGCRGNAMFPFSALSNIEPFDAEALPEIHAAMRWFLDDEEGQFWTQEGWMTLYASEDAFLLGAVAESGGLEFINVELTDDEWRWAGASGGGDCQLQVSLPAGMGKVTWRLDPAEPAPGPDSLSVVVLASENACASGEAMGDRLLGPEILLNDSTVAITFAARSQAGFHDCQGNPEQRVVVEFAEPLGERQIVDGLDLNLDLIDFMS